MPLMLADDDRVAGPQRLADMMREEGAEGSSPGGVSFRHGRDEFRGAPTSSSGNKPLRKT